MMPPASQKLFAGVDQKVAEWLLAGDPAVRWQTMRDLLRRPRHEWRREQTRIAKCGWGAELLTHRDESGRWTPRLYGRKWLSTTYSLVLLRQFGLPSTDARAVESCRLFLEEGLWHDGGMNLSATQRRSETCITGMVLGLLSWFDVPEPRRELLVDYLLREQMTDGGWNCQRDRGASHSSFHTTINVLEGLRDYATSSGPRCSETAAAEEHGREFLLRHRLYRSDRTGRIVDPKMTRLSFPPRWRYDILRGLDYFRSCRAPGDERLDDAIRVLIAKRRADGRWPLQQRYPGAVFFDLEDVGEPSRWNTLRALRVLGWWQDVSSHHASA